MSDKLCIDLCSGLGGFSAAFRDAGWEVITVDIDPKFKPTICKDIMDVRVEDIYAATKKDWFLDTSHDYRTYEKIVILASPPCERFSLADMGRGNTAFPGKGIGKALAAVGACLELIAEIQPDAWMLENPKARLRWFLGRPGITVNYKNFGGKTMKPTDLWGSIQLPLSEVDANKKIDWMKIPGYKELSPIMRQRFRHRRWTFYTKSASERALIPYGLSQAILEAVSEPPKPQETSSG